jgi:SH3 domain-containing YSC84-like protein 1
MRRSSSPFALMGLMLFFLGGVLWAADTQADLSKRLDASAKALNMIMSDPQNAIPESVLKTAKCLVVIPSMTQVAVGVGGSHGDGIVTCRTAKGWSAPAPVSMTGGSWGAQIGAESVDLVMVVTDDQGMQQLLSSKFTFGTEATVAVGPVGKHAGVSSDANLKSEVLTYSKARGIFVGTNLNGASIAQDKDDTQILYGQTLALSDILTGKIRPPQASQPFMATVHKYAAQTRVQG